MTASHRSAITTTLLREIVASVMAGQNFSKIAGNLLEHTSAEYLTRRAMWDDAVICYKLTSRLDLSHLKDFGNFSEMDDKNNYNTPCSLNDQQLKTK